MSELWYDDEICEPVVVEQVEDVEHVVEEIGVEQVIEVVEVVSFLPCSSSVPTVI